MGGAQHTEQCPGSMPSWTAPVAAALAVALAAAASGCADDAAPTRARDGRVNVRLDDFLISPQRIRAAPGRITFRVSNQGEVGHTLRVKRGDRDVAAVKTLLPGASATASGTFSRGDYKLVCTLGNHEELGMYGTLTVR
jgi:plastocyanin